MKNCQFCGHGNTDDMRFCLECGKPLPDAPIVFNLQDSVGPQSQSGPGTNPYGQSMQTQFGGQNYQQPQFSMVPPSKPRSNKKMYIAVAGVFALILLVVTGIGGIVAYNFLKEDKPIAKKSPSPSASSSASSSPSPSASASPSTTATPKPSETKSNKVSSDARATSDRIWVDFNVKEGGKTGMRIHTTFTVYNLKGTELYLALYFQKSDGTPLMTSNAKYSSSEGQTAVFESLKPAYDEALYDDIQLFIPYDEFKLSKGNYNLKVDADVIYKGGGRVDHLDYYEFEYEKF